MNNMQIFYNKNKDLTIVLRVVRGWSKIWQSTEQNIRNLLEKNFEKVNEYNTVDGSSNKKLDRIILYPSSKKETHFHVYRGAKEHLDEILTFCNLHKIGFREGIGDNLKEKYSGICNKDIQALLNI